MKAITVVNINNDVSITQIKICKATAVVSYSVPQRQVRLIPIADERVGKTVRSLENTCHT